MQLLAAKVTEITALNDFVQKLELNTNSPINFKAGQYLQVLMGENDKRPFSIASTPDQTQRIELHIGASPDNPYAYEVIQRAKNDGQLRLEIGLGDAFIRESQRTVILIAGGTGYSYTKSILNHVLKTQPDRDVILYWGVRQSKDLYEHADLLALDRLHQKFRYVPVVELDEQWEGKKGMVHTAVLDDWQTLADVEVYTAGRFEMAATIREEYVKYQLSPECLFGDAYAFI